jgi:general stress protein YciG
MAKKRGFASMDSAKQREIASKGGKAAHEKGTAHQFTPDEARAAGRRGGQAAHFKGTAHKFTSEEARAAGRKGGRSGRSTSVTGPDTGSTPTPLPAEQPETPMTETGGPGAFNEPPESTSNSMFAPGPMPATNPEPVGPSI